MKVGDISEGNILNVRERLSSPFAGDHELMSPNLPGPDEAQTASVNDLKRYSHVVTKVGHFDTKCGHFVAWRNLPLLREPILLQNMMSCRDVEETSMMALDSRQ